MLNKKDDIDASFIFPLTNYNENLDDKIIISHLRQMISIANFRSMLTLQ